MKGEEAVGEDLAQRRRWRARKGVESREACIHNPAEFTGQLELLLLDPSTELQPICSGKRLGTRTQVLADDGSDPDTLRLI